MKLELYHRQSCPFSAKVRDYSAGHQLKDQIPYFDIEKEGSRREILKEKTSDEQVPCLMIDGKPLLESDDIIAWLESHEKELRQH